MYVHERTRDDMPKEHLEEEVIEEKGVISSCVCAHFGVASGGRKPKQEKREEQ